MDPIKAPGTLYKCPFHCFYTYFYRHTWSYYKHTAGLLIAEETDLADEEMYLRKYNIIDVILKKHFPDAPEALLDKLAADLCDETES